MNAVSDDTFFDYYCTRCDARYCERVHLMNMALDYLDDEYCLPCLAREQELPEDELISTVTDYIHSRECFKTPWDAFDASRCPRLRTQNCYCQGPRVEGAAS